MSIESHSQNYTDTGRNAHMIKMDILLRKRFLAIGLMVPEGPIKELPLSGSDTCEDQKDQQRTQKSFSQSALNKR